MNRKVTVLVLAIAVFGLIALANIPETHAQTWEQINQNENNTNYLDVTLDNRYENVEVIWSGSQPGTGRYAKPVLGNIDLEDNLEMVVQHNVDPDNYTVQAFNAEDGTQVFSFDADNTIEGLAINNNYVYASTETGVYKIDNNGDNLWFYDYEGTTDVASPPTVADADGDGNAEVLVGFGYTGAGSVVCLSTGGDNEWQHEMGNEVWVKPAVRDLDSDGTPEVVAASDRLHAINGEDGTLQWSYFFDGETLDHGGVSIGDVTGNGSPNVVVAKHTNLVLDSEGNLLFIPTWYGSGGCPLIADLDGDGVDDIIFNNTGTNGMSGNMVAVTGENEVLWSEAWGLYSSPLAGGDIDGDGDPEFITLDYMDESYGTYARNGDNVSSTLWKIDDVPDYGIAIGDVNNNSRMDIAVMGTENVTMLEMTGWLPPLSVDNSTLAIDTNLPTNLEPTATVTKPDLSTVSHRVPDNGHIFSELPSGTVQVDIQDTIGYYHFQEWTGDISSTRNPVSMNLSDKTVKAIYAEETSPPPVVPPKADIEINGETGTMREGEFTPKSSFVGGQTVFVRAEVTLNGTTTSTAEVEGSWNGSSFGLIYSNGYYQGSFVLPKEVSPGTYTVQETAEIGNESASDSQIISVDSFPEPPTPGDFPGWFKWVALASLFLMFFVLPEDRWDKTQRNWWSSSGKGSWTFSDDAKVVLILSVIATGFILFFYGFSFGSIFYSLIAVAIIIAVVTELFEPDEPLASICFDGEKEGRLMISGLLFALFFVWVSSWLGELMSGTLWPYSIVSTLMSTLPENLAFLSSALMIPLIEENLYSGICNPTLSEKIGVWPSIMGVGLLFGFSHVLFGAGIALMIISTLFGIVTGWMVLRNQSLLFPIVAHVTYNSVVLLVTLGVI